MPDQEKINGHEAKTPVLIIALYLARPPAGFATRIRSQAFLATPPAKHSNLSNHVLHGRDCGHTLVQSLNQWGIPDTPQKMEGGPNRVRNIVKNNRGQGQCLSLFPLPRSVGRTTIPARK